MFTPWTPNFSDSHSHVNRPGNPSEHISPLAASILLDSSRHHHQAWDGADSRFAPSQWETPLLCNDVSHWLRASLESALWCSLVCLCIPMCFIEWSKLWRTQNKMDVTYRFLHLDLVDFYSEESMFEIFVEGKFISIVYFFTLQWHDN